MRRDGWRPSHWMPALMLIAAAVTIPAAPAGSSIQPAAPHTSQAALASDFNGDGYDDLAISDFGYNVGNMVQAGAASVIYGSATGLASGGNQLFTENSPGMAGDGAETGDLWARALAAADFNGDGFADLAIAAGNEDVGGVVDSGAVTVVYGSPAGLDTLAGPGSQWWNQDTPDIQDQPEFDDNFGRSVYGADFDGDGFDDLAIGVTYEDIGTIQAAGAVQVIYGTADGLDALAGPGNQFFSQDSPGIQEESEVQDRLGWCLTAGDWNMDGFPDLAVGAPGDDVNGHGVAGVVNVLNGSAAGITALGNQLWTQDSADIQDQAEQHDAFGRSLRSADFNADGFPDLAVGVPGEGVGPAEIDQAGAAQVIYGSPNGLDALAGPGNQYFTQDTPGIKDMAEPDDLFGRHLGVGDFNGDGFADLSVGVVSEDLGDVKEAGAAHVIYGSPNGLQVPGNSFWTQNTRGIQGVAELYDAMGRAVMGFDFNADGFSDLAIGVPGDYVLGLLAAGGVNVLMGSAAGVTATGNRRWTMETPGILGDAQEGALFGAGFVGLPGGSCGHPTLCTA
jgi:FG-GAP repeat